MISIAPLPGKLRMRDPAALIATGLGSGRLTPAPGTWGSVLAWIIAIAFLLPAGGKAVLVIALIAACIAGWWAIEKFEEQSLTHDSGMIVIDEFAGIWLTLLLVGPFWDQLILALIMFRVFDVWKPFPIGWLDKNLSGAFGIMADDIVAGLAAGLCVYGYGLLWTL